MIWLTIALLLIGCGKDGAQGLPGIPGPTGATGNDYLEYRVSALETRMEIVEGEVNKLEKKACNKNCKKHCH